MRRLKAAAALGLVVLLAGQVGLAARVGLTAFPAPRARGAPGASDCSSTAAGGSLYDHTATGLDGSRVELAAFAGKVSLVVNLATFWGGTVANYRGLNDLQEKLGNSGFQVLGFPCGQFGNQEPGHNDEILAGLAHVRPGQGFAPNFPMFAKVAVNGADADPIFTLLRTACKPGYVDELGTMEATQLNVAWSPVTYTDVSWNFEKVRLPGRGSLLLSAAQVYWRGFGKFVVGKNGYPLRRFHPSVSFEEIEADIRDILLNAHGPQ